MTDKRTSNPAWLLKDGIFIGSLLSLSYALLYSVVSFNPIIFVAWLSGLIVCGCGFYRYRSVVSVKISRLDLITFPALFLMALPFYVWSVYTVPYQVIPDETVLIGCERYWVDSQVVDVFGISNYFGFPYFPYLVLGWLGKWLGGVDLYHQRLLHGIDGALIVACSFVFFRVLGLRWALAVSAALFVCANHSFIAISRLAFKDNGAVLVEVLALCALFHGLKNRSLFATYLGGLLAGFAFYQYYPARITIPVWLACLCFVALFRRSQCSLAHLIKAAVTFALGLTLAAAPLASSSAKVAAVDYMFHQRRSLLIYPQGRELLMQRLGEKDTSSAVLRNIIDGLTLFNSSQPDRAHQYFNENHGFVDPISGVLIWIGVFVVIAFRRMQLSAALMLCGLAVEMFFFAFIVTDAPNYTRLLVILPIAGFFVANGIDMVASLLRECARAWHSELSNFVYYSVIVTVTATVVLLNVFIYSEYVRAGYDRGDDTAATVRYVESKRGQSAYLFIVSASAKFPYFSWDTPPSWQGRLRPFAGVGQECKTLAPDDLTQLRLVPPFTIFMNAALWNQKRSELSRMYPQACATIIYKATGLVAFDDPTITQESLIAHRALNTTDFLSLADDSLKERHYDQTIKLCLETLNKSELRLNGSEFRAGILRDLGIGYMQKGEYQKAEGALLEASKIETASAGPAYNTTAEIAATLGDLYGRQHKWAAAETWYRQAANSREGARIYEQSGITHSAASDYRQLARACREQGKFAAAKSALTRAIELYSVDETDFSERAETLEEIKQLHEEQKKNPSNETLPKT